MPVEVIERALRLLPGVDFVNAYGLTETSSTLSVLGPDDHREAIASEDPAVRRRLGSVGRPHGAVEVSIRDPFGVEVGPGESGEIWVRGDQVSGEYAGKATAHTDGWFPTRDGGSFDEGGYLFVEGRLDDVIVRGGENISPGEIEDVIRTHEAVVDVAVVGVSSQEWGEDIVAFVVATDPAPDEVGDPGLRPGAAALVEGPGPRRVPRRAAVQRDRQAPAPRPQGRGHPAVDLTRPALGGSSHADLGAHGLDFETLQRPDRVGVRPSCGGGAAGAPSSAAGGGAAGSAGGRWSPR